LAAFGFLPPQASTTTSTPALVTRLKLREALEKVGNDLGVTKLSDWYNITPVQVRQLNRTLVNNLCGYEGNLTTHSIQFI
jgi:hypothetical protein